jgi:hypothetical protein
MSELIDNQSTFTDADGILTPGELETLDSFGKQAVTITKWGNKYSARKGADPNNNDDWIEFEETTTKDRFGFTKKGNNKEKVIAHLKAQVEDVRNETVAPITEEDMDGGKRKSKKQRKSRKSKGGKSKKQRK